MAWHGMAAGAQNQQKITLIELETDIETETETETETKAGNGLL